MTDPVISKSRKPKPKLKPKPKESEASTKEEESIAKRWGAQCAKVGWTAVPNLLLYNIERLKLTSGELVTLLLILSHFRQAGIPPYVSKRALSTRSGKVPRTIQGHITSLCEPRKVDGNDVTLVERVTRSRAGRQQANAYRLDGLIKVLNGFAPEELARRQPK